MTESPETSDADDARLVARIVASRDDAAFAEIVRRHGPTVLGVCRRLLRNQQDAEDAFQATFIVLSLQARSIRNPYMLGAWLWGVARHTALRVQAVEQRRREAERKIRETPAMQPDRLQDDAELQAIVDAELDRLSPKHRAPVLMCYIEGKSNREAAKLLGWPDGTLATRLREARQILRKRLARKGVGADLQTLAILLAPVVVSTALASSTVKAATTGTGAGAASAPAVGIAKGVVKIMACAKLKTAVVGALAVLFVAGSGVGVSYYVLRDPTVAQTASVAATIVVSGPAAPHFTWEEAPPEGVQPVTRAAPERWPTVIGDAHMADGSAVVNAHVYSAPRRVFFDAIGQASARQQVGSTDAAGQFQFTPTQKPMFVVVTCDQGIGSAKVDLKKPNISITLQPWGRIEGVAFVHGKPSPHQKVQISFAEDAAMIWAGPGTADEAGHFVFNHVPPGKFLSGLLPEQTFGGRPYQIQVEPGSTAAVKVGGAGRVVAGRFSQAPLGANSSTVTLYQMAPGSERLQSAKTDAERNAIRAEVMKFQGFKSYQDNPYKIMAVALRPDGSFEFPDVAPGFYQLSSTFVVENSNRFYPEVAGTVQSYVRVPEGGANEPIDIGSIPVEIDRRLAVGDTVPDLEGTDSSGQIVRLSQMRGKYILLSVVQGDQHMWRDLVKMISLRDRVRDSRTVGLATFHVGKLSPESADMQWPLIDLGNHPIPDAYLEKKESLIQFDTVGQLLERTLSLETILLIDPQGKLLAKNLDPQRAYYVIDKLLGRLSGANASTIRIDEVHTSPDPRSTTEQLLVPIAAGYQNVAFGATFQQVDSATIRVIDNLHDGHLPKNDDDPTQTFNFRLGTLEGRFRVDLHQAFAIDHIVTYSRHKSDRGPQVYTVYGSIGDSKSFNSSPKIGTDPTTQGWTRIASVDNRPESGKPGGSYAVTLSDSSGSLGSYRHLLFVTFPTEVVDPFGHTFFGEVEVIAKK